VKIAAIGKLLRLQPITDEEERQQMIGSGNRAEIVAAHVSIYVPLRCAGDLPDDEA